MQQWEAYRNKLDENMSNRKGDSSWDSIKDMIVTTAEEVVGYREIIPSRRVRNEDIEKLSTEQKNIWLQIKNTTNIEHCRLLKTKRRNILKQITSKLKQQQEI